MHSSSGCLCCLVFALNFQGEGFWVTWDSLCHRPLCYLCAGAAKLAKTVTTGELSILATNTSYIPIHTTRQGKNNIYPIFCLTFVLTTFHLVVVINSIIYTNLFCTRKETRDLCVFSVVHTMCSVHVVFYSVNSKPTANSYRVAI